ncbi:phage minor head protein [Capnocytophaga canimorsus]|uniref:phage minor head protein n=1 Tax=Capnocytophaga canimorsus TaxID=28188 RepID=UPI0037D59792
MSRLVEKYIRQAFEDRDISEEQSEKLWQYYYRYLSKAVDLGYNAALEQYDPKLALSLKYNIAEFSAFKETSFKKQIEAALTQNGRVLSWGEFKAEADKLNADYNRRWLQTEYHQTIANAQVAEKFQDYLAEKSVYPNLKYRAINDERTREKHRVWDGLVLPVEHPFWQKHLPPNDWGCRCYVEQTAEPETDVGANNNSPEIKDTFANNPALSGQIFNKIPYEKGLSEIEIAQVKDKVKERLGREAYKPITIKTYENGGKIISSNLVNSEGSDYERVYKCCEFFAQQGKEATILPRFNSPLKSDVYKELFAQLEGTPYWGKCPDFKVDNKFYEHEGFTGKSNDLTFKEAFKKATNMITKGIKQSDNIIIDYTPCDFNAVKRGVEKRLKKGQNISEIWILKDTELERIY